MRDRILSIDVGNTTVHLCEIKGGEIREIGRFRHEDFESVAKGYKKAVAVSVRESFNERLREFFGEGIYILRGEDIPLEVEYETPQTLGTDRILNAWAVKEFYSPDGVIVSAGTALVIDLLDGGVFRGGFITAGPRLKAHCLSARAEAIPEIEPVIFEEEIGKSTEDCLKGGIYLESRRFIEETLRRWSEMVGRKLPIFITGGDGWLFEDLGTYDPLLIHRGLGRIIINR